jgi:hypothetical protein
MRAGGSSRVLGIGVAIGLVSLLSAVGHAAGGGEDVDALVNHGVELRKAGKDSEALAEFQRAAQVSRTPRVVAQIALAEMALGTWVDAEEHLLEALSHPDDPWIKKNHAALEKARATADTHLGSLEIWGTPAGAEVAVDGRAAGTFPLRKPIRLAAGAVTVTVRAPGYFPATRTLQVEAADLVREHVDLSPVAAAPPPARVDLTPKGESSSTESTPIVTQKARPTEQLPAPAPEPKPLLKQWWLWTIVGVVVVGGAVATIGILGNRDRMPPCPAGTDCPLQ